MALVYNDAPGSVPATYTLAPGQTIDVECVTAQWDGTAASAGFLACLAAYSQDGKLVGRYFPETQFSVGDTGEVSYFPFGR